ncbi:MAG TPA: PIN domain-containing protein [Anaerolineae bacterium]|nr:PIN domain-containing protein [Anaerolineae bacterium]
MKLFIDSSAWIALFDQSDKYHVVAASALRQLEGQAVTLFTSDYIFDEAITVLLNRGGHHVAVQFGRWLQLARNIEIVHIDQQIWQAAWEMFQLYTDKEWAFTDCTSFVLMHQQNIWQAFTFDHHFSQAGFQRWPLHN